MRYRVCLLQRGGRSRVGRAVDLCTQGSNVHAYGRVCQPPAPRSECVWQVGMVWVVGVRWIADPHTPHPVWRLAHQAQDAVEDVGQAEG